VPERTKKTVAHEHFTLGTKGYKHSEYVILTAYPLQQWLHEHALLSFHMYIACLVF